MCEMRLASAHLSKCWCCISKLNSEMKYSFWFFNLHIFITSEFSTISTSSPYGHQPFRYDAYQKGLKFLPDQSAFASHISIRVIRYTCCHLSFMLLKRAYWGVSKKFLIFGPKSRIYCHTQRYALGRKIDSILPFKVMTPSIHKVSSICLVLWCQIGKGISTPRRRRTFLNGVCNFYWRPNQSITYMTPTGRYLL